MRWHDLALRVGVAQLIARKAQGFPKVLRVRPVCAVNILNPPQRPVRILVLGSERYSGPAESVMASGR